MPIVIMLALISAWFSDAFTTFVLICSSLVFYAFWEPIYVLILTGSVAVNFFIARYIQTNGHAYKFQWLIVGVTLNLCLLIYFKYTIFLSQNLERFLGHPIINNAWFTSLALPLGISFFTFQQVAFLVDSYKRKILKISALKYVFYVTFFPQRIAGPIVRYLELEGQIAQPFKHRVKFPLVAVGVFLFVVGICKKTLIADPLGFYFTDPVFEAAERGDELSFITAWIGTISFSLQIYFDFSGYTDMALGLGRIFGFVLPANFNAPYKSTSIIEFWRRWHMTLSRFLRDYLYVPLGGNQNGFFVQILAVSITMFLGGLWHGASWLFVFWGIFHGVMIIINHLYRKAIPNQNSSFLLCCLYWFLTMLGVCIAWVLFRAQTFEGAISMIMPMLLLNGVSLPVEFLALSANYLPENFIEAFSITFVGRLPFDILGAGITISGRRNCADLANFSSPSKYPPKLHEQN